MEYVILGFLNHEPISGYDLKKRIDFEISNFWPETGFGKIYPTLKKLEKEKQVSMKEEKVGNRPSRKVYSITKEGKERLRQWLLTPIDTSKTKHGFTLLQELLIKLYFSGEIPREESIKNIEEIKLWINKTLDLYAGYEQNLRSVLEEDEDHRFFLLAVLFGKIVYEGVLDWTKEAMKLLKTK